MSSQRGCPLLPPTSSPGCWHWSRQIELVRGNSQKTRETQMHRRKTPRTHMEKAQCMQGHGSVCRRLASLPLMFAHGTYAFCPFNLQAPPTSPSCGPIRSSRACPGTACAARRRPSGCKTLC